MTMAPTLIVGLGNPGSQYAKTRHNVGFWLLDALAARWSAPAFSPRTQFESELTDAMQGGQKIRLLKPMTYMNDSGRAVGAVVNYWKLSPQQVLVVHDEIDLPVGQMRLKQGGGHGGHNGLRDLIDHVGKEFIRLRIGVGHPGQKSDVVDYVLKRPSRADEQTIVDGLDSGMQAVEDCLAQGLSVATQQLHKKT